MQEWTNELGPQAVEIHRVVVLPDLVWHPSLGWMHQQAPASVGGPGRQEALRPQGEDAAGHQ
eukprot:5570552-Pyramimonas_sp.AAC.1